MANILQTTFSYQFHWMKSFVFWLEFHWIDQKPSLIQVMVWHHQAPSHFLNQCWLKSVLLYMASLGYNELSAVWKFNTISDILSNMSFFWQRIISFLFLAANTVCCCYTTVKYEQILNTAMQWLMQDRTEYRLWVHKWHPISHTHAWAMGMMSISSVVWEIWRILTML